MPKCSSKGIYRQNDSSTMDCQQASDKTRRLET